MAKAESIGRTELVRRVAEKTELSQNQVDQTVRATLDEIQSVLAKGGGVQFQGFGTFSVSKRKARKGRNPQTGAEIQIAASKAPKFKPGTELKAAVNR